MLQDLKILNLSNNHLKGIIPNAFFSSFLDRGENDSDSDPDRSIVDNSNDTFEQQSGLRSLHTLQLSSNELSGSFPISSIFTATATATATATVTVTVTATVTGSSNLKILQ